MTGEEYAKHMESLCRTCAELCRKLEQMTKHRDEQRGMSEYWYAVARNAWCMPQPRVGSFPSVKKPADKLEWEGCDDE